MLWYLRDSARGINAKSVAGLYLFLGLLVALGVVIGHFV